MNRTRTINYIKNLLSIPSPTGFTKEVTTYIEKTLKDLGYNPIRTNKGSIFVTVKGKDDSKHRVVTAHVDTLGAMVRAIKPDGRLKMAKVGGYAWNMIEGENCLVHLADGSKTYSGTILIHQTSVHVYSDAGTAERTQDNMEIRLDEEVTNSDETKALGINVGDFISFDPRIIYTETGFLKSRFLDDKVSAGILLSLLESFKENNITLPYTTHFGFSVFEEVGFGMNSSIPDKVVEYLSVDMGAMGDDQQTDEYTASICAMDSSGPYNFEFRNYLVNLAKENNIPYKVDIYPRYGSDASSAMKAGIEAKHALLGAGIESSHSYERTNIKSIEATYNLVKTYLKSNLI